MCITGESLITGVTAADYPSFIESLHVDIQSAGQKEHKAISLFAANYYLLLCTGYNFTGPVAAIAGAGPALTFTDGTPARISSMSSQYDN
jgi:hypothetical protein